MIAICIGHSRAGDSGAVSVTGTTEHTFNSHLGQLVVDQLQANGHQAILITKYNGQGYIAAMRWLGRYLREIGATVAIELHFNASDSPKSRGYEYLHHAGSHRGRELAAWLTDFHRGQFPANFSRGLQAIDKTGRGYSFLHETPCPAVICEPFFGTNPDEWANYTAALDKLALVYASALIRFLKPQA